MDGVSAYQVELTVGKELIEIDRLIQKSKKYYTGKYLLASFIIFIIGIPLLFILESYGMNDILFLTIFIIISGISLIGGFFFSIGEFSLRKANKKSNRLIEWLKNEHPKIHTKLFSKPSEFSWISPDLLNQTIDLIIVAEKLMLEKNFKEALTTVQKAIKLTPKYEHVWDVEGRICADMENYDLSLESFDKGLRINPNNSGLWGNKGNVYRSMGNFNKSLECYNHAIILNPGSTSVRTNLIGLLIEHGQFKEALLRSDEQLYLKPFSDFDWFVRGQIYTEQKKHTEAIKCYKKALGYDSKKVIYWHVLSLSYYKLGQFRKSLRLINKAIMIDNDLSYQYELKGKILKKMGKHEEASKALKLSKEKPQERKIFTYDT